jgi:hypothetical protein
MLSKSQFLKYIQCYKYLWLAQTGCERIHKYFRLRGEFNSYEK